jgi:hypothetical protein
MGPRHLGVGRATWTQVEDAGGAKRRSHCWAYDRDRKRMSWWGHNKCVTAVGACPESRGIWVTIHGEL